MSTHAQFTSPAGHRSHRGQSLTELALLLPLLLLLVGGVIQYGVLIGARHSLIQVGRDVGRWAATQGPDACDDAPTATPPQPLTEADAIAQATSLLGYSPGDWNSSNFTAYPNNTPLPASPPRTSGVEVVWSTDGGAPCPPADSTQTAWVTVRLTYHAPVLLPGLAYVPGIGTCTGSDCYLAVSTTAQFRMEPNAGP